MASHVLSMRELGQLNISIGTSLALESVFGVLENPIEGTPNIADFTHVWINLRTLFRNIHGALSGDKQNGLQGKDLAVTIFEEALVIRERIKEQTNGAVEVNFYYCMYKNLQVEFPKANLKELKTTKQQMFNELENEAMKSCIEFFKAVQQPVQEFDVRLKDLGERVLLFTHLPVDLVNVKGFSTITLLESHTGKTKTKPLWNSKLSTSMDVSRLPFDRMTLQLFGDGKMFGPLNKQYREKIISIAEKHRWNPSVGKDRVMVCISVEREPIMLAEINSLY